MDRFDWRKLEEAIGLEWLPAFHRAFLAARGVDAGGLMLRRVQQAVERELNRLVLEGRAERSGDQVLVDRAVLDSVKLADGRGALDLVV
jgi:hypothetical protein